MSKQVVLFLSGPNLGLLGVRQPEIYGSASLADHIERARACARQHKLILEHVQSEHEADLVRAVHQGMGRVAAIVVNAGALSHYGWSLHDALACFQGVVVELHLSNPDAREPWRHHSVISPVADGTVSGFGGLGYELAVEAASRLIDARRA
jgi:3-dehydroquinate dehydratase II